MRIAAVEGKTVRCDRCGVEYPYPSSTVQTVRTVAHEDGWRHFRSRQPRLRVIDVCPTCWPKEEVW